MIHKEAGYKCQFQLWRIYQYHSFPKRAHSCSSNCTTGVVVRQGGVTIRWGKFSQKHNYEYMARWWCLLATDNYMFRPIAAIIRFWQLSCY